MPDRYVYYISYHRRLLYGQGPIASCRSDYTGTFEEASERARTLIANVGAFDVMIEGPPRESVWFIPTPHDTAAHKTFMKARLPRSNVEVLK